MLRTALALTLLATAVTAQGWPLPPTDTGNLFVSGFGSNNVGEFKKDGTLVRTFTHPTMNQPRGLAIEGDGTIVVVVQQSSRVLRFAPDGTLVQTITHPDLTSGTGISRAPNGNWYVGSFSPGRVVIFDSSWNYVSTLTNAAMNGVNCVSFDSNGSGAFAVTAAFTGEVFRFDAQHQLLGTVTHANMISPMSIASDSAGARYVSQGGSGRVIKFDSAWNPLLEIGGGTLPAPQGVAIDENDVLTISSFSGNTVFRYDTAGNQLSTWNLSNVTTGRNMAWQTSAKMIARAGSVGTGVSTDPQAVLAVSGQAGDGAHRVYLATTDVFDITMQPSAQSVLPPLFVLYAQLGEPGMAEVVALPFGIGPMAFAPPFAGGAPLTLANNIGLEQLIGVGVVPAAGAPTTVLSLPGGLGYPLTITLQGVMMDSAGAGAPAVPFSTTNAVTVVVN